MTLRRSALLCIFILVCGHGLALRTPSAGNSTKPKALKTASDGNLTGNLTTPEKKGMTKLGKALVTGFATVGGLSAAAVAGVGVYIAHHLSQDYNFEFRENPHLYAGMTTTELCPPLRLEDKFNLKEYMAKPWYSQYQTEFMYQKEKDFNCTKAEYKKRERYDGWELSVKNTAKLAPDSWAMKDTEGFLCATASARAKFIVAPCFLSSFGMIPKYNVLFHDEETGVAIVVTGTPVVVATGFTRHSCKFSDGEGMWIMTRQRQPPQSLLDRLLLMVQDEFRISLSQLVQVPQDHCED